MKDSMVVPVAKEKVRETLDKMELGNILTARDVELVTTQVYKESLNNLVLKVHDIANRKTTSSTKASSNPVHSLKELREELLNKQKQTGLMGFRDFTFDHAIEHGIRSNVQSQINSELNKQLSNRKKILEEELQDDMKLHKKAEEMHY